MHVVVVVADADPHMSVDIVGNSNRDRQAENGVCDAKRVDISIATEDFTRQPSRK